jgi:DNA-directed RNA polymerase subunit F
MILKGLAAFLVLLIVIAQALKFIETDWEKLDKFESQNVIVIEDEIVALRPARRVVTDREKKARKRDLYDAMTKTEQYKWRQAWCAKEKARVEKEELAQFEVELENAIPVSPAPAGMNLNG